MKKGTTVLLVMSLLSSAFAAEKIVQMLPGECWWGLCSNFGRQMPFTAKTDFKCDLRVSSYGHQSMSLLVSDKGRTLWCEEPVEATILDGRIKFVSDDSDIMFVTVGTTLADAFRYAASHWFPSSGELPDLLYFTAPQLNTWIELTYNQNEKDILKYARAMKENGVPPGIFMIDDTWQIGYGVWDFDRRRFDDPKSMVAKLHEMGYKVLLWMCPYVSMDCPAYRLLEYGVSPDTCKKLERGGFVMENKSRNAAVVDWWNGRSALLDFSHRNGSRWFEGELDRLVKTYGIDGFKFDGSGVDGYCGFRPSQKGLAPWRQNDMYVSLALKYKSSEIRGAFGLGGKPMVVRLLDKSHKWSALNRLVPDMLVAGMIGCPFVCPDMIGGGQWVTFLPGSPFEPELFIRSAQVHALSPMMQISASPWRVLDKKYQAIFKSIIDLRQRFVPRIEKLVRHSAKSGEPIMRSLEYVFPNRGYSEIKDQFMVGDDLLVAPVLKKGAKSREVVLPPGEWMADDGQMFIGNCRIRVSTPIERLPYFVLNAKGEKKWCAKQSSAELTE